MNIAEAKDYIKDTVKLYLKKDEFGDYRIPVVRQRPIFLLGAPGIGKTAVMSQIASELDIALVSYSMTHHTRQSALGLPFIEKKDYDGKTYSVSEYTMSEIIASVYDTMEESGVKEGILFLDEINCVSETLYPSMLQFLQYKVFGKHTVPEGWVIVTAGNPPEFNKAVREFDVVTLDRLKVIEVEADYPAWKKYAFDVGLHGSILNFLETNRDYFYGVETTAFGKNYVTARGWEDLSDIIYLYEEDGKKVTESLIGQYIKNDTVVKEYTAYYDLYNKYKKQYDVEAVFEGRIDEKMAKSVKKAAVDERLALTGLLSDIVKSEIKTIMSRASILKEVRPSIGRITDGSEADIKGYISTLVKAREKVIADKQRAGSLTSAEKRRGKKIIALYNDLKKNAENIDTVKSFYNGEISSLKEKVNEEQGRIDNLFKAMAEIFGEESNEMLVLVTELTLGNDTAEFFASFKNDSYEKYNALLMVGDRKESLRKEILNIL
ncbi:MAG: AAA family ATPase [Lachnospiraceae bacterium]|nr:AAA family ATPase [Lachnospiraceae bacterium]